MPAADTDRIQGAQLLTDAAAQGRLDMSEYEDRLKKAYAAQTFDELDRLSAELLGIATTARSRPRSIRAVDAAVGDHERLRAARRAERAEAVDVGRLLRRRRDRPALRRLHLGRRGIHSYSICGGQTILVPPEVNVDLRVSASWAVSTTRVSAPGAQGARAVTVRGFSLWGSVGVRRKTRRAQSAEEHSAVDRALLDQG